MEPCPAAKYDYGHVVGPGHEITEYAELGETHEDHPNPVLSQHTPRCSAVICCEPHKVIRRVNLFFSPQDQLRKLSCNEKCNTAFVY